MTTRGAIILLLPGIVLWIVGAAFKIRRRPHAGALLLGSSSMQAIAVVVVMIELACCPEAKDFLDS